jgi:hypothetical protein
VGLLLCKETIIQEGTKNITLVNCFTQLSVDAFPSPPQSFYVFAALTGGLGDGIIQSLAHRLDTFEEIYSVERQDHFPDRLVEVRVLFRVSKCSFPVPGQYQFSLRIDQGLIAQCRLQVQ